MMHQADLAEAPKAERRRAPLPLRDDTILGVCEGLGEELGFNPLWLRIALSAGLLWNPLVVVGLYFGLGLLLAAARLLFPAPGISPSKEQTRSERWAGAGSTRDSRTEEERIAA